jgi:general secretion pathway protein D
MLLAPLGISTGGKVQQFRVIHRASVILIGALALIGCQDTGPKVAPAVAANSALKDLNLSTAVPPPLLAASNPVMQATLVEPVIVRRAGTALPRHAGSDAAAEATISLNFDKASLRTVIEAVLGDALQVPYTVDDRVEGTVTLVSPGKLTRDQALDALDGVLRMNNAALIRGEHLYRVVLAPNAHQNLAGPGSADQPGYAISVYVPRHNSAVALQKLIEPLYQLAGAVSADRDHNLLIVTGGAEERRALFDAAKLFDQDWLSSQSIGLFPLRQAAPRQMAADLRGLFGGTNGTPELPTIRFTAIDRLNAVLVVALDPSDLDRAASWIEKFDRAGAGERTLHVYPIHYAKVADLSKLLGRLFSSSGGGAESGNAALPAGTAGARVSTAAVGTPAGAANGSMPAGGANQGGSASGFASSDHSLGGTDQSTSDSDQDSGASGGSGARVIADPASNTLLALVNQSEARTLEEALVRLDAQPPQILIEATVVEVTLNKSLQFGVQYFLRGTKFAGQADSSIGFTGSTTGTVAPQAPGFNGVIGTLANPSVIVSALDAVTDSKILSSPQLLVRDAHEALLKVGTQTPLLTQQAITTQTSNPPIVNTVEYHDTGVILRVLPRANEADMVSLDISQEVSQVVPNATNPLTPDIDDRRLESSVTIRSGQTVMLGGLISENNSLNSDGLPILSSLPVVGPLFGTKTDTRIRTELVIFITPHILRSSDDARRLTEELTSRLTAIRPPGS